MINIGGKSGIGFLSNPLNSNYIGTDSTSPSVTLNTLTLSNASFYMNAASGTTIGAIQNATSGSTLSLVDDHSGAVALSSTNLVVGLVNTPTTGTWNVTIRETLAGATNTPKDTTIAITVNAYTDASITAIDALGWQVTTPTPPSSFTNKIVAIIPPGYNSSGTAISLPVVQVPMKARLRQVAPNDSLMTAQTCYLAEAITSADTIVGSSTNNSTENYPLCIANWASGDRYIVGNTVTVYLVAFHYYGVACIVGTADDGSGHTATATTSTQIVLPGNDANKIVGYALTFDVTSFNDKQNFTVNAKVYPKRGTSASVLDSSAVTTITGSATSRNFGPRSFRKDITLNTTPIYAYVSPTGNDGTGVISTTAATALAAPYATIDAARIALKNSTLSGKVANSDDGCVIRLMAGNHALNSMTIFTNVSTAALIIEAAPGESASTVTLTSNATAPPARTQWLRVRNVTWVRGGGGFALSLNNSTAAKLFVENCNLNNGGQSTTMFNSYMVSIIGGTVINGGAGTAVLPPTTGAKYELIRGITLDNSAVGTSNIDNYNVIGCNLVAVTATNLTNNCDNVTIAFNKFMKCTNTAVTTGTPSGGPNITGVAVAQNVFEWISATATPVLRPSGDGSDHNISNYLLFNNTSAGFDAHGRENIFYDDTAGTIRRTHKWILDINNGKVSTNTKIDRFVAVGNLADAPNRIGAWWHAFGVGTRNNHHRYLNASAGAITFGPEDFGLNATAPTTNTTPGNDPKFVNYQGTTGSNSSISGTITAGAGNGNYHIQAESPYIGKVPASDQLLDFDLDGVARKKDGTGACGAYEYV